MAFKQSKNKVVKNKLADYQKNGNLPTIQILIVMEYKLSQYYQKVKIKNESILDLIDSYPFRGSCPLCRAANCARFIGCYERAVIDEEGSHYNDFPVARFLCQGKGQARIVNHKTFSLLHYQLVPYRKYAVTFINKVLWARYIDRMTQRALLDYIADFSDKGHEYVELSWSRILSFQKLIKVAIDKVMTSRYYPQAISQFQTPCENEQIKAFLLFAAEFYCYKFLYPIRGPCALCYDFYLTGGSYFRNSYFLLGKPSQFRTK